MNRSQIATTLKRAILLPILYLLNPSLQEQTAKADYIIYNIVWIACCIWLFANVAGFLLEIWILKIKVLSLQQKNSEHD